MDLCGEFYQETAACQFSGASGRPAYENADRDHFSGDSGTHENGEDFHCSGTMPLTLSGSNGEKMRMKTPGRTFEADFA